MDACYKVIKLWSWLLKWKLTFSYLYRKRSNLSVLKILHHYQLHFVALRIEWAHSCSWTSPANAGNFPSLYSITLVPGNNGGDGSSLSLVHLPMMKKWISNINLFSLYLRTEPHCNHHGHFSRAHFYVS